MSKKSNNYKNRNPQTTKAFTEQNVKPPQNSDTNTGTNTHEFNTYYDGTHFLPHYRDFNIFERYSPEQLKSVVSDPMGNNDLLREISLILYGTNGIYTNTVDYMVAMPTLDKVIVTHGKSVEKKRTNKRLMESTLRAIKDKEFVRDALFRGMIEGVAYYYFETSTSKASNQKFLNDFDVENVYEINDLGMNAAIISLPADYTEIVARRNSTYVLAFNLDYFREFAGQEKNLKRELKKFPQEIRDAYRERQANPKRGNWYVLDSNKTIVHKIRSKREEKYGRPLVLAAISDILYNDYFTSTKRNVLDDINNRIIYQTFPEGEKKGTSSLTKQQQENQHSVVKRAVLNKNERNGISFFSVAAGTKISSLDAANTDIFDEKYESDLDDKIALGMGIAASLLNGSASGNYSAQENNLELITAQLFQWIEQIAAELNKCIMANIIKDRSNWVECKYLPITHVNKSKMVGYAKDLYLQGKGSLSLWASACGIEPDVFFSLLDQELEEDVENKYPVHQTSYTLSKDNTGGRPTTDDPSANTVVSRALNGNSIPSPSDK